MKAASPRWLSVMVFGCMLEVCTVFLLEPTARIACQLSLFFVVFGFTLAFGSLFLKNYRILRVFNNPSLTAGIISDRVLFAVSRLCRIALLDRWSCRDRVWPRP